MLQVVTAMCSILEYVMYMYAVLHLSSSLLKTQMPPNLPGYASLKVEKNNERRFENRLEGEVVQLDARNEQTS